jgi:molybdate transport system substrate-binding protein
MDKPFRVHQRIVICSACAFLILAAFCAGCTSSTSQPAATAAPTTIAEQYQTTPTPAQTQSSSIATTAGPVNTATTSVVATSVTTITPAPTFTPSEKTLIVYTAASLKNPSSALGAEFSKMYPGYSVIFNLDGTQALKTQVENGAYADVFISASNSYTSTLKGEGYFINDTVKPLTTNYVIVIVPASNPGNINSLKDLATPGKKLAIAKSTVPVGTATYAALANLAKSTYGTDWNTSVFSNVVTYETSEPAVATKVSLGEVDAGVVYESTYAAATPGTLNAISIPKADNYLQTYTIGILKQTENSGAANDFENFMLGSAGQQILKDYGFRPSS